MRDIGYQVADCGAAKVAPFFFVHGGWDDYSPQRTRRRKVWKTHRLGESIGCGSSHRKRRDVQDDNRLGGCGWGRRSGESKSRRVKEYTSD